MCQTKRRRHDDPIETTFTPDATLADDAGLWRDVLEWLFPQLLAQSGGFRRL
jgi:hypothetical protein